MDEFVKTNSIYTSSDGWTDVMYFIRLANVTVNTTYNINRLAWCMLVPL